MLAHSSERVNSGSEGDASKVEIKKTEAQCSCLLPNQKRSIPRAEEFRYLITAEHKVLNEGRESLNNHRFAVVVHVLVTQWIQSYPCLKQTSLETQRSLQKF